MAVSVESQWLAFLWNINSITTFLVFVFTFTIIYMKTRRRNGVPPGPPLWPVIGNIPSLMSDNVLERLDQLRGKYGDIYGLYIGSDLNIFLNGYTVIHEALVKNGTLFSRRPLSRYSKVFLRKFGIVFNNGEPLKRNRTFALNALRDVCFYDKGLRIEDKINEEIAYFLERVANSKQPLDPSGHVNLSFSNVIFYVIHGRRIGYDDKAFNWYMVHLEKAFKLFKKYQVLLSCFSFLSNFPIDVLNVKQTFENEDLLRKYHRNMCEKNFENYVEGSMNCLIDCYLTNMLQSQDHNQDHNPTKSYGDYYDDNLWLVIHDLMAAGSETSATTLKWIIFHAALNPKIQSKIQQEIDGKLGKNQTASLSDRDDLPYVEATVLEGLRIGTVVPLAVPHGVTEDTIFQGYLFPKEIQVFVNVASVLKDPDIFPEPEMFKPERFLSEDLKTVTIPKEFIPFSIGPRSCIGETLAKMELFLYTATLFQKFDLTMDPQTKPSFVGEFGLTNHPKNFRVFFNRRHDS